MSNQQRVLCISSYEKGQAFLREIARLGFAVELLTVHKLRHADWPWDVLAEIHTMPEELLPHEVLPHVTRLVRHKHFERVISLDEFDLETAALIREHLRLPGMGQTATRYFRDKLAMRQGAMLGGINVPAFYPVANHDDLWQWMQHNPSPWLLKPRSSASAIGIRKVHTPEEVWPLLEQLGDQASHHLLERFVPGDIYHVEGISWEGELLWAEAHKYGKPPMQTMHEGGVFTTRTLPRDGEEAVALRDIHARMLRALGMNTGVTHSEFIRAHEDGRYYFLETAARVGGAFIANVVENAAGINPWVEWARLEAAQIRGERYDLPEPQKNYAGSVLCLAKQDWPDLSAYDAPEVTYRMNKFHHAGLIVKSDSPDRVQSLLTEYGNRFLEDFYARIDAPDKPPA